MGNKVIFILALWFSSTTLFASTADTIRVYSKKMNKEIKVVVLLPDNYSKTNESFPVVYLLHGYSDNYATWLKQVPDLHNYADEFNMIIVMPDGGFNSWYWDSPVDAHSQYETFISSELICFIDKHYHTLANRNGRAITGNSMGGQGALFLAIRHQDVYGAAGSLSGGVDIRPFPKEWDMATRLGQYKQNKKLWNDYAVINLIDNLKPSRLQLIIDCGTGDFFYEVNETLHNKLLKKNIPHTYITHPGEHNWDVWNLAVPFQFRFFKQHFNQ